MSDHAIVHIEFPASDPRTSARFYADLFDWKLNVDEQFDYHMFQPQSGPGGGFVKIGSAHEGGLMQYKAGEVLLYISTDDIDASLAQAESLGGTVVLRKTEIPQTGWFAVFADPAGNHVGLFTGTDQ